MQWLLAVSPQQCTAAQSWGSRGLHVSNPALAVEDVLVPSMGDSITEGQHSAILHRVAIPSRCKLNECHIKGLEDH